MPPTDAPLDSIQTFSPDSRWLIVASLDSVIRTFDIPSGRLVDAFRTTSIPTSITFSPTGDFLATSHVDSVGVYLWANKSQFSEVALRAIEEDEIFEAGMPSVQGMEEDEGKFLLPFETGNFSLTLSLFVFHSPQGHRACRRAGATRHLHDPGPALGGAPHALPPPSIQVADAPQPRDDQSSQQAQGATKGARAGALLPALGHLPQGRGFPPRTRRGDDDGRYVGQGYPPPCGR